MPKMRSSVLLGFSDPAGDAPANGKNETSTFGNPLAVPSGSSPPSTKDKAKTKRLTTDGGPSSSVLPSEDKASDAEWLSKQWHEHLNTAQEHAGGVCLPLSWPRFIINPLSNGKSYWDASLVLLVLYTAVLLPWNVAFVSTANCDEDPSNCYPVWLQVCDIIVDIFFWADLVINFRTAYIDPAQRHSFVTDSRKIAVQYAKGWLAIDLAATVPFDDIIALFSPNVNLLILKIFKLPRLLRLGRLMKKLDQLASADYFRIFRLLFLNAMAAHWVACVYWFVGRWQMEQQGSWQANPWFGGPWIAEMGKEDPTTGQPLGIEMSDLQTQYTVAMYWSMSVMTSMTPPFPPYTNTERCFTVGCQLLGAVMAAIIFGNVAVLVQRFDVENSRFRDKMQKINEFMTFHMLPAEMVSRVRQNMQYLWEVSAGLDSDEAMGMLPTCLRTDIQLHLMQGIVGSVAIFKDVDEGFIKSIVTKLKAEVFLPGDIIIYAGEVALSMFFLGRGIVQVVSRDGRILYSTLYAGSYFGESILADGVEASARRSASVQSITYAETYVISKEAISQTMQLFPEYREIVLRGAKEQSQKHDNSRKRGMTIDEANSRSGSAGMAPRRSFYVNKGVARLNMNGVPLGFDGVDKEGQ